MNTVERLGHMVGIQRQALIDRSEAQRNEGLTSALIIGQFRRGRTDQPMTIHQGNIRGQLGHDPLNPDYIAVQACLDTGVPSVQVLRVGDIDKSTFIYLTSKLYPIEIDEQLTTSFDVVNPIVQDLYKQSEFADNTSVSFDVGNPVGRFLLRSTNTGIENVSVGFDVTDPVRRYLLHSTDIGIENIGVGFDVGNPVRRYNKVDYDMKLESLDVGFDVGNPIKKVP